MAATPSVGLLYSICGTFSYSSLFSPRFRANSSNNSSSSPLSTTSSSHFCSSSGSCNFSGVSSRWNNQSSKAHAMSTTIGDSVSSTPGINGDSGPDHLIVLVHGIMASPNDWTYFEAELKKRLGKNFLFFASSSNTFTKTFSGIDGAGKRLAEEVRQVVHKTESLKKISFLAHSLGGLFARYAVAVLYTPNNLTQHGLIAGLEPISFITLASPHLGVRGKNQLPFLMGLPLLERLALPLAPVFAGRTGSQLFLTDGKPDRPPLLLKMATDCEDRKFLSALGTFRCRILYANVSYDHMVGWRTSSIRRETELPKPPRRSLDGYQHVVDVDGLNDLEFGVFDDWWSGESEMCKKLFLEELEEKDVGFNPPPPSYIQGRVAVKRRREKIRAAKTRINSIRLPSADKVGGSEIGTQGASSNDLCLSENVSGCKKRKSRSKKRKKQHDSIDWEDFIIETLLLHKVKEEEIEKGHYKALLGLHVFNGTETTD